MINYFSINTCSSYYKNNIKVIPLLNQNPGDRALMTRALALGFLVVTSLAILLTGSIASAASYNVILDKSTYNYGDTIKISIIGTMPCNLATVKIISPQNEDVKVLLVTQADLRNGVSTDIPALPTTEWITGVYRVDVICGSQVASATFKLEAKPLPPPPSLPIVYVTVSEWDTKLPVPKAIVVAYDDSGKVVDVEETNKDG